MRIVYVLTSLGMGGAERQVITLATRMAERGHAVALLVLRSREGEEWATNLRVHSLGIRKTPLTVLSGLFRAHGFLISFRPDIVHSHGFHANLITRLLRLVTPRCAILSTVHNVYEGGWHRMAAYRLTDGLSDRTTAVSQAAADRFIRLKAISPHKCVIIPNAIDPQEFAPSPDRREIARQQWAEAADGNFIWLAAGRIAPAKDYSSLLRAFERLHAVRPEARLWIAGEGAGALAERLQALTAELRLGGLVRWLGLRRDLPELLDGSDAFVQASAWEGMPLAIGEAMCMEKPIVATDVGGVREMLGDAGVLVRPGHPQALADAMLEMMEQPPEALQALGRAARLRVQRQFNMETRIGEWERLYAEIAQPPDSRET